MLSFSSIVHFFVVASYSNFDLMLERVDQCKSSVVLWYFRVPCLGVPVWAEVRNVDQPEAWTLQSRHACFDLRWLDSVVVSAVDDECCHGLCWQPLSRRQLATP